MKFHPKSDSNTGCKKMPWGCTQPTAPSCSSNIPRSGAGLVLPTELHSSSDPPADRNHGGRWESFDFSLLQRMPKKAFPSRKGRCVQPVSYPRPLCAMTPLVPRAAWGFAQQFCKGNSSQNPAPCSQPPQGQPGRRGDTVPQLRLRRFAVSHQNRKSHALPQPCPCFPSTARTGSLGLPATSSQPSSSPAEGWERRSTDEVFETSSFLAKALWKRQDINCN